MLPMIHKSGLSCLSAAGLSLLNLSLDTLRPERFEQMTRRRGHERVLETLDLALSLGFEPVKVPYRCFCCLGGKAKAVTLEYCSPGCGCPKQFHCNVLLLQISNTKPVPKTTLSWGS